METPIIVARILAISYLTFAIGIVLNTNYYKKLFIDLVKNPFVALYSGFLAIVFGLIILYTTSCDKNDWTIIINIIGWISLLKGIILLVFPKHISFYQKNLLNPKYIIKVLVPLLFIFGLVLGYFGFIVT
jgi:uncharacterized membrane protein